MDQKGAKMDINKEETKQAGEEGRRKKGRDMAL